MTPPFTLWWTSCTRPLARYHLQPAASLDEPPLHTTRQAEETLLGHSRRLQQKLGISRLTSEPDSAIADPQFCWLDQPPSKPDPTAAQQRQLGQVPTPPSLPVLRTLLEYLARHEPEAGRLLEGQAAQWKQASRARPSAM